MAEKCRPLSFRVFDRLNTGTEILVVDLRDGTPAVRQLTKGGGDPYGVHCYELPSREDQVQGKLHQFNFGHDTRARGKEYMRRLTFDNARVTKRVLFFHGVPKDAVFSWCMRNGVDLPT